MAKDDNKMTVFEKQLSLIDSSSISLKDSYSGSKRRQPPVGYFSGNSAVSSIGSGDSTLIGSSNHTLDCYSPRYKHSKHQNVPQVHLVKRKNSIHLRIPLFYLTGAASIVRRAINRGEKYSKSFTKEELQSLFDILSIVIIGITTSFASEIFGYNKKLFITTFPMTGLCVFNFNEGRRGLIFSSNYIQNLTKDLWSLNLGKKQVFQLVLTLQFLLLCSLTKVALHLKSQPSYASSFSIDQFLLMILVLLISALSVNMVLNSIPGYFKLNSFRSNESQLNHDNIIEKDLN